MAAVTARTQPAAGSEHCPGCGPRDAVTVVCARVSARGGQVSFQHSWKALSQALSGTNVQRLVRGLVQMATGVAPASVHATSRRAPRRTVGTSSAPLQIQPALFATRLERGGRLGHGVPSWTFRQPGASLRKDRTEGSSRAKRTRVGNGRHEARRRERTRKPGRKSERAAACRHPVVTLSLPCHRSAAVLPRRRRAPLPAIRATGHPPRGCPG